MTPKSFLVAYKGPSTYQLTLGEGSMKSAIALSFITKFMPKIMSWGGRRVKKWLKIASIDVDGPWDYEYVALSVCDEFWYLIS